MKIQESAENYLEAILELKNKNGQVRSIDIAHSMGFSKPSVSIAMKQLRENGYITVEDGGLILLTEKGEEIACKVFERHVIIGDFLVAIGVGRENALEDACKIEHDLCQESFDRLKEFYLKNFKKR